MYCGEFCDNEGSVSNIILKPESKFSVSYVPSLLNGINQLTALVDKLTEQSSNAMQKAPTKLTLIPFNARSHRGKGEMQVWFPAKD